MEQAQCPIPMCDVHHDEEVDIYCYTCKRSICFDCVKTELHSKHSYDKISKLARTFRQEIPSIIKKKDELLSSQRAELGKFSRLQTLHNLHLSKTIEGINVQRSKMHSVIDDLAETMISTSTRQTERNLQDICMHITNLTTRIKDFEESLDCLQKHSNSLGNYDLLRLKMDFEDKINQSTKIQIPTDLFDGNMHYVKGEIIHAQLRSMLGQVGQNGPKEVSINIDTSFSCGQGVVTAVVPVSSENCWVLEVKKPVKLINKHGRVMEIKEIIKDCHMLDVSENGTIFSASFDRKTITKTDVNGSEIMLMSTEPLKPSGISIAVDGDLLLTLADEFNYNVGVNGRRILQVISTSGEVKKTHEFESNGSTRLFTYPRRARQNYNWDICVVDATGNYTGRLCILGFDGKLKAVYNGQKQNKIITEPFIPQDVRCDPTCNIIINDLNNHAIHLLNPSGQFVKFLLLGEKLIAFPKSLGLHTSKLWIGTCDGQVKVYDYKYI